MRSIASTGRRPPAWPRNIAAGALRCASIGSWPANAAIRIPQAKDRVLNLLAVEFAETDAPAGTVILTFSGGGMLRLEVECLECELADLGPVWTTTCCPDHAAQSAPTPAPRAGRVEP